MCGIFGLLSPAGFDAALATELSSVIRHRGPDDEGFLFCSGREVEAVAGPDTPPTVLDASLSYTPRSLRAEIVRRPRLLLGHRRLSIIDLSPAGHQPMAYADRYWLVYNGEVFNYLELRKELQAEGITFRTESDSEVILAAYDRWGENCLARFNGMWGLAILDRVRKTLFIARDRFGVKPVYYTCDATTFGFASEIKALLPLLQRREVNQARLLDFLAWGISDHTAESMFDGVLQLPPGHHMTLDVAPVLEGVEPIARAALKPVRWYTIAPRAGIGAGSAAEAVGAALESAVRLRLRADVPVGSCLSGGIDSSSIVCMMSRLLGQHGAGGRQKTFSARSDDPAFDESAYARTVAEVAGAEATFVTPGPDGLLDRLDDLVWHQDEPFLSASVYAQWCVFGAARKAGVVVMLDGQGADESLGGYRGFFGAYLASLLRQGQLRRWVGEAGAIRAEADFTWKRAIGYTIAYLHPQLFPLLSRMDGRQAAYSDRAWLRPAALPALDADPVLALGGRASDVRGMSVAQLSATNLPMLLRWEDRNSMAFSVEARVPFLDYRFVELALGLPDAAKVGGGISKRALREAMRGLVPDVVLDRRDKMGFVTSEALWMTRDVPDRMRALLSESAEILGSVVEPQVLLGQHEQMCAGQRSYDHRIWRVIVAGRWIRRFGLRLA